MKKTAVFLLLASSCMFLQIPATFAAEETTASEFPYIVPFELGEAEFAPGDSITITAVRGTQSAIMPGQSYCIMGTYTLESKPEAQLAVYTTTTNAGVTPTGSGQTISVQRGSGTFTLVTTMYQPGYLHVTYYAGSDPFGGVYFGQGEWVLRRKGFSYLRPATAVTAVAAEPATQRPEDPGQAGNLSDPNRRLIEYLGNAVAAPANLDPAYSKEGLVSAVSLAAQQAGLSLKRLEIDDSEFPFLVGIICAAGDWPKVREQLKQMPTYEEQGGVFQQDLLRLQHYSLACFPGRGFRAHWAADDASGADALRPTQPAAVGGCAACPSVVHSGTAPGSAGILAGAVLEADR